MKRRASAAVETRRVLRMDWSEVCCVFSPGKTASTSIFDAITLSDYRHPVVHSHSFTPGVDTWEPIIKKEYLKRLRKPLPFRLRLVIPIREPIARNKSSFLQNMKYNLTHPWDGQHLGVDELWEAYTKSKKKDWILVWFDKEIKENLGIDVYATPFPNDHCFYSSKNVDLLILHHDIPNTKKNELLNSFLGTKNIIVEYKNTAQKRVGKAITRHVQELPMSEEYLTHMLTAKYTTHFFNDRIDILRETHGLPFPNSRSKKQ